MKLHIDQSNTILEVQERFQKLFPHYKLEFFFDGNEALNLSARLSSSFSNARIGDLCVTCPRTSIDLDGEMTVLEAESEIKKSFGLPARVYVERNGYWQKNALVDNYKLKN